MLLGVVIILAVIFFVHRHHYQIGDQVSQCTFCFLVEAYSFFLEPVATATCLLVAVFPVLLHQPRQ